MTSIALLFACRLFVKDLSIVLFMIMIDNDEKQTIQENIETLKSCKLRFDSRSIIIDRC
jgi:hypothetical protein